MRAKGGLYKWGRAFECSTTLRPAEVWRRDLAETLRVAADASFAAVMTCPPGDWYGLNRSPAPSPYAEPLDHIQNNYLKRIDAAGEGWRFALQNFGPIYAPLDNAMGRELAEEIYEEVLEPIDIHGYLSAFLTNENNELLGLVVLGSEHSSDEMLANVHAPLLRVCQGASQTLSAAIDLARGCQARGAFSPAQTTAAFDQERLTKRQREVAALAAQGFSNLNIANNLNTSVSTIGVHLRAIYRKLSVHSRVELANLIRADVGKDYSV